MKAEIDQPLNFEMAATEDMLAIALRAQAACRSASCRKSAKSGPPKAASMSPGSTTTWRRWSRRLGDAGIRVSLFIGR